MATIYDTGSAHRLGAIPHSDHMDDRYGDNSPKAASTVDYIRVATQAGTLTAFVIIPNRRTRANPLVVLHGISRNAQILASHFRQEAERNGRLIIVPFFSKSEWPHFQRPGPAARADQALVELLNRLALRFPECSGRVDLAGHSGGAQLAHRMAMLYPQRIGRLNLVAAGWYCLPDTSMPFPYGLGENGDRKSGLWVRRKKAGLAAYLGLEMRVFIGTHDTQRDPALRISAELDAVQGRTRYDRARNYVKAVRNAAREDGRNADISLIEMPGCAHDVEQAITEAGLARLVAERSATFAPLASAS